MRQEIILIFVLMMLSPVVFYFVVDKKDDSSLVVQRKNSEDRQPEADPSIGLSKPEYEIGYSSVRVKPRSISPGAGAAPGSDLSPNTAESGLGDARNTSRDEVSPPSDANAEVDWMALYSKWELNVIDSTAGKAELEDYGSQSRCSLFFKKGNVTTTFTNIRSLSVLVSGASLTLKDDAHSLKLSGLANVSRLAKATNTLVTYCSESP